ncbi:hypothetical protein D3C73_1219750 [compost metagenome]
MLGGGITIEDDNRFCSVLFSIGDLINKLQLTAGYQYDGAGDILIRIIGFGTDIGVYDRNRISTDNAGEIIVGQFESHHAEILISGISY